MSLKSIYDIIEQAEQVINNLPPEDLDELINKNSFEEQQFVIKKFEILRGKAGDLSDPQKSSLITIIDSVQFIRICMLDLSLVFYQFRKSGNSDMEKNISYRISAMIIYELIEDIPRILGKKFRESATTITSHDPEIDKDLKEISKAIISLKKEKLASYLKDIRNVSIAHKDHDVKKLLKTIDEVKEKEFLVLIAYIFVWYRQFEEFLVKLTSRLK